MIGTTGIAVLFCSSSVNKLVWVGSKCAARTNAMPLSVGIWVKKFSKASRPPADAPIATMGESIAAVSDAVLDAAFFIGDGLTGAFF
ncbi:MAG: hypothetical protein ACI9CE_000756 [Flavobacterium sp.]